MIGIGKGGCGKGGCPAAVSGVAAARQAAWAPAAFLAFLAFLSPVSSWAQQPVVTFEIEGVQFVTFQPDTGLPIHRWESLQKIHRTGDLSAGLLVMYETQNIVVNEPLAPGFHSRNTAFRYIRPMRTSVGSGTVSALGYLSHRSVWDLVPLNCDRYAGFIGRFPHVSSRGYPSAAECRAQPEYRIGEPGSVVIDWTVPAVVTIEPAVTSVTEGSVAPFALTRHNELANALTVTVELTQDGEFISGGARRTATFAAGSGSTTLAVQTVDDQDDEPQGSVTATLVLGSDPLSYRLFGNPDRFHPFRQYEATVRVSDNDAAAMPGLTIADQSAAESAAELRFTVALGTAREQPVTVDWETSNETATARVDYEAGSGTLTFAPGTTRRTIRVRILNDIVDEPNETFTVELSNPSSGVTLDRAVATGTIEDDDARPALTIANARGTEGGGALAFAVSLSAASRKTVTVRYATEDGTATGGTDYTAQSGTLDFSAGTTRRTITVPTLDDRVDEPVETFTVRLSEPSNATLADATATGTIADDDGTPKLWIADARAPESAANMTFEVTLLPAASQAVTVDYATADGTATQPADYTETTGMLTFAPGTTRRTITVPITSDETMEGNETFIVKLSNPSSTAELDRAVATGVIEDDDVTGARLSIVADQSSVAEGSSNAVHAYFTVTIDGPFDEEVAVTWATSDGTATAGQDYSTAYTRVRFRPGDGRSQQVSVFVVDDLLDEDSESFEVTLVDPENAVLGTASAPVIIDDNDDPPALSFADGSAEEGDGAVFFTMTLTPAEAGSSDDGLSPIHKTGSGRAVTGIWATYPGSATEGDDYQGTVNGVAVFSPGQTSVLIRVPIVDDELDEEAEDFTVRLIDSTNATLPASPPSVVRGIGTIRDDDAPPELSIADAAAVVEGETASFVVSMVASAKAVTVGYATSDGTAKAPGDYTAATAGTLTFAPGDTQKTIAVTTADDALDEEDGETFTVRLSGASNATLADAEATGTIDDNDELPALSVADAAAVTEGGTASFVVSMVASGKAVTVGYSTSDGTAEAPGDYTAATGGTLTFAPGDTEQTIDVATADDALDEEDGETFTVRLSGASNATLADAEATGTIDDNDELPALSVADAAAVTEGETASFVVSMVASGKAVTVGYSTSDGTAEAPGDYTATAGTLTFAPGDTAQTITVATADDALDEEDGETFTVRLSGASNATLADAEATGTIDDNDELPALSVADAAAVTEGETASFVVSMVASGKAVTVGYSTSDGTAEAPGDYTATAGTLTFAPGDTAQTITVATADDALDEEDGETFTVTLSDPVNATLADAEATGTIDDNDDLPALSVADATAVVEGETASFVVSMVASGKAVTVGYSTSDGTAEAPGDYTAATAGTLTFAAGDTEQTITVATADDALDEEDGETFTVTLSDPVNATLADAEATGTIDDNDELPELSVADATVTEGGTASFVVSMVESGKAVTVRYATADGTAVAPGDYTAATAGTLTFAPGDTEQTIEVATVDDALDEADETFTVTLSAPGNAVFAGGASTIAATGTIEDDDAEPELSIADESLEEADADLVFTVRLRSAVDPALGSGKRVTVGYTVTGVTAAAGADYTAVAAGTLSFAPGERERTIAVPILEDALDEVDETFTVTLSAPADANTPLNATLSRARATGTIRDDDQPPELAIADAAAVTEGGTASFEVTMVASGKAVTVGYSTSDGTAKAPGDYAAVSGTVLNFAPGETAKTIEVETVDDALDEDVETFRVRLSNPSNATLGDGEAEGRIDDNDRPPALAIADAAAVTEGGTASFEVTMAASGKAVTVTYATADGTAAEPGDYVAASDTLNFAPGETAKTIEVETVDDALDEVDGETFEVRLSNPSNATLGDGEAEGRIDDNDRPPALAIADAAAVTEGGTASFEVTMAASGKAVTVTYATADGTAAEPGDYVAASDTLNFAPGETAKTIEVETVDDALDEDVETFRVRLSNPSNATLGDGEAEGRIDDNDRPPELAIADAAAVTEGGTASFEVTMAASGKAVTVTYATADGTAAEPGDYAAVSGTVLNFAPGETAKTVTVETVDDALDEDVETFRVRLSNPSNATLGDGEAEGRIDDNDRPPELAIADAAAVTEGGTASFEVTMAASGKAVTVTYATADGTAAEPGDYAAVSGTVLNFAPGETAKTVTVETVDDALDEDVETFTMRLSSPSNATLADPEAEGTITDDDDPPELRIADALAVTEGGTASFVVSMAASGKEVTVAYATADGTAAEPGDYVAASDTLNFAPGETAKTVTVETVDDALDEVDGETFEVRLSNPSNATLGDGEAEGRIDDNDRPPALAIADAAAVTEGGTASFEVTMAASGKAVTVTYATADGTAAEPGDYVAASDTLNFAPGETAKTIEVETVDDALDEVDGETFEVRLSNPSNATLGDGEAEGRIDDNDRPPALAIADAAAVTEGGTASFEVTMAASGKAVTVTYATADGTAAEPGDYAAASDTLNFAPGETAKTVTVETVDDALDEDVETFRVRLSNPSNATLGDGEAEGRIDDNDRPPALAIADAAAVTEGGTASFEVTMAASGKAVTVTYATADGTAAAPGDYTAVTGATLTFTPGDTEQTIRVATVNDALDEDVETFTMRLSSPSNATLADPEAEGTITDDDDPPELRIAGALAVTEGETASFVVSMAASGKEVTVRYSTSDGTAAAPGDYTAVTGATLTFTPGDTEQTIRVATVNDALDEDVETFTMRLSSPSNATLADPEAEGTITDDDDPPELRIAGALAVTEGETASFVVSMAASGKEVTVRYSTSDGTAAAPGDYTAVTGATLTFTPGDTEQTIRVATVNDALDEDVETFTMRLSSPSNATLADPEAEGTITDDDDPPELRIAGALAVTEGETASFVVSMAASGKEVTVRYSTSDGTAAAPGDYTAVTGATLTFTPGDTEQTIRVATVNDALDEDVETFTMRLSSPSNATLADPEAEGTITDNDDPPELRIADALAVTEGGTAAFVVSMAASGKEVTVRYSTSDGTAAAPGDYTAVTGATLTFAPGDTEQTIRVTTVDDALDEDVETFTVRLSSPSNAALNDDAAEGRIDDNDAEPELALEPLTRSAAENAGSMSFTVTLGAASGKTVSVGYATANGTAESGAGKDYGATSGTLTFSPGALEQTVSVPIHQDELNEAAEDFTLTLSDAESATLAGGGNTLQATGTIADDDALTVRVSGAQTVVEGNPAAFTVMLTGGTSTAAVEAVYTVAGTATAGTDYTAPYTGPSGTLTITAGASSGTIAIATRADAVLDPGETLAVRLASASTAGAVTVNPAAATTTIADTGTVTVSVTGPSAAVREGTAAAFQVALSGAVASAVTVGYETANGTAESGAGKDYGETRGALTFTPGALEQTVSVPVHQDDLNEAAETFTVELTGAENLPAGVSLGTARATATIADDDALTATVSADAKTVNESQAATFTVQVTGGRSTADVAVAYTVAGTATAGSDYTAPSGVLTITAGASSGTITIDTLSDDVLDRDETLEVRLDSAGTATPTRAVAVDATATVTTTIVDTGTVTVSVTGPSAAVREGTAAAFQVELSGAVASAVTVGYETANGTAESGAGKDYEATRGALTFTPGALEQTVSVPVHQDDLNEAAETFTVELTGAENLPAGVSLGTAHATATIADDDALRAAVRADAQNVAEDGEATFTVQVTGGRSTADVAVAYTVTGTATAGADYTAPSGTLRIDSGASSGTIRIAVLVDDVLDPGETLEVTLDSASTAGRTVTVDTTATVATTIADAGTETVSVSAPDSAVAEGSAAVFTVELSGAVASAVTVGYETANGTAESGAGKDYAATRGTLTFGVGGDLEQTVTVPVHQDDLNEAAETFTVTLAAGANLPPGVSLGTASAVATIADDDTLTATVRAGAQTVGEGGSARFTVELTGGTSTAAVVVIYTVSGTATAGADYTAPSGTLRIDSGASSGEITIAVLGDEVLDPGETLEVTLSSVRTAGAVTVVKTPVTTTITEAGTVTVAVSAPAAVAEGMPAAFTVKLSGAVAAAVPVGYETANGTAESGAGKDYGETRGVLTFSPGESLEQTVTVPTHRDELNEDTETFRLELTGSNLPPGVSLGTASAVATIADDDTLTATVRAGAQTVGEGGSARFTVELTGGTSTAAVEVVYTVAGTATAGADYTAPSGTLRIDSGASSGTIRIAVLVDDVLDPGETLVVALASASTAGRTVTVDSAATVTTTLVDTGTETVSVADATAQEGETARFEVTLSGAVASAVRVSYATANGDAVAGVDYAAASGALTFRPGGALRQTIAVTTTGDDLNEADETFTAKLTGSSLPPGVSLGAAQATGTITDDDALTVAVSADAASVMEGGSATFTVELTGGRSTAAVVVDYTVTGTATAGSDYTAPSGVLTITAGASSGTIAIATRADAVLDPGETLEVRLASASTAGAVTVDRAAATTRIADAGTETVSVAGPAAAVAEGMPAAFTVTLSGAVASAVTVGYETANGTAESGAGKDYAATSGTLTFGAGGALQQTVSVPVHQDDLNEAAETFTVTLATGANLPAGVSLGTASATATIADDDTLTATVRAGAQTVAEGGSARFTVELTGGTSTAAVEVVYTVAGTATTGSDYTAPSGTLMLTAGETSGTITIPTKDDGVLDPGETLEVTLSSVRTAGAVTVVKTPVTTTITEAGTVTVAVSAPAAAVAEGSPAAFKVKLSGAVAAAVPVGYGTANGTAESGAGKDYGETRGVLTFSPGESLEQTVSVPVHRDELNEDTETFRLELTGANLPAGVSLGTASATATIADDDTLTATVRAGAQTVAEGGSARFTVELTGGTSTAAVEVVYTVAGTATAGTDYTAAAGTVTIAGGAASGTITLATLNDTVLDPGETLVVALSSASTAGRTVTVDPAATATTTIVDMGTETVSVADATAQEGETARFAVTLSGAVAGEVRVSYATADGGAVAGIDYAAASGALTFRPGEALRQTIAVATTEDDLNEADETFTVTLTAGSNLPPGVRLGTASAVATIADDDTLTATVRAGAQTVGEGGSARFTVELTGGTSTAAVEVVYTVAGTATAGSDYTAPAGALTIGSGAASGTITLATLTDRVLDPGETLEVALDSASTAGRTVTVDPAATATTTIVDTGTETVSVADATAQEGETARFAVTLSGAVAGEVRVSYATADGGAVAGVDYAAASGALTFRPGEALRQTIAVATTEDDLNEADETFTVTLTAGANLPAAVSLGTAHATATIADDDALRAAVRADAQNVAEGGEATFTVQVTGGRSTADVAVAYTVTGTATAGSDYRAPSGALTITAGASSGTIRIAVLADDVLDPGETLEVTLGSASTAGRTVTVDTTATVATTIADAGTETVSVAGPAAAVAEGTPAAFTVMLSGAVASAVTVGYETANGTAESGAGKDYAATSGTLTFGVGGALEQTVTVPTHQDELDEDAETFTLELTGPNLPAGVSLGTASATATIADDDDPEVTVSFALPSYTVAEGSQVTVTVELSADPERGVTIPLTATPGDGAVAGDYEAPGSVSFDSGETAKRITITAADDAVDDDGETVSLSFGGLPPRVSAGSQASAEVSITDNDRRGVRISPVALNVPEGDSRSYEVVLESEPTADVTVTVVVPTPSEIAVNRTELTFTAADWDQAQAITVTADDDDDALADAAVVLMHGVSGGDYNAVPADPVTVKIIEDDVPTLSIADVVAPEDVGAMEFSVTLSAASSEPVTVDYETAGGTATEDVDYMRRVGTLTFPAHGTAARTISVPITNDTLVEEQETFTVTLSGPVNAALGDETASGAIIDDDEFPMQQSIGLVLIGDAEAVEGAGPMAFTVRLKTASSERVSVAWATADGTATAGADYQAMSGTVEFAAGVEKQQIRVPVLDDTLVEERETFTVTLSEPVNAALGDARATGTITDDDRAPDLMIADARADESASALTFEVTLSSASGLAVTVAWETADVTAHAGEDYTAARGRLTFMPGDRAATIGVEVLDDDVDEEDEERLRLVLRNPVHAALRTDAATGTITDDDVAPGLRIAEARVAEGAGPMEFTVTLGAPSRRTVTVAWETADGTAHAGEDYTAARGRLTFMPGDRAATISVEVLDDTRDETDETFTVALRDATHATLADATVSATGTIIDDDESVAQVWLSRLGREVATHVLDAIGGRLSGESGPGSRVTVAGQRLERAAAPVEPDSFEAVPLRTMEISELLSGSSFRLSPAVGAQERDDTGAGARWTAWGRGAATGFEFTGEDEGIAVRGQVITGTLGFDYGRDSLRAGLAVAYSGGGGEFTVRGATDQPARSGEIASWLVSVHPYLHLHVTDWLAAWGLFGYGVGGMSLTEDRVVETDLRMTMGAFGARGALLSPPAASGFGLAVKSDGFVVRMHTASAPDLPAAEADVNRARLVLEGYYEVDFGGGEVLRPSLQVGVRHDGGDGETGSGLELGGGLRYVYPAWGLTLAANGHALLVHEDSDYREWGAGGEAHLDPGAPGRGVALSLNSSYGVATGVVQRLWVRRAQSGLSANGAADPAGRLAVELGYGLEVPGGRGALTPYAGVELAAAESRAWRVGGRFSLARSFNLSLEGTRRESPRAAPEHGLALTGTLRW